MNLMRAWRNFGQEAERCKAMSDQWCHYCEERLDDYSSLEPPACMDCVNKALAQLKVANEDTVRLDWLDMECRGSVRGTDYPKWSIESESGALREAIDKARSLAN